MTRPTVLIELRNYEKQKIIRLSNKQDIKMIDILDNKFPLKLKYIDDAPIILFYKGNYNSVINDKSISVVGSRKAGKECLELSYNIAKYFAREGYTIVSGLANGCDEYAHKGCLETKGNTAAVLGGGLDNIYPKRNINLAENIVNNNIPKTKTFFFILHPPTLTLYIHYTLLTNKYKFIIYTNQLVQKNHLLYNLVFLLH